MIIKKIAGCFNKILGSSEKETIEIEEVLEFEDKFPQSVVVSEVETCDFKELKEYIENKEIPIVIKKTQEKIDMKSKYLFGDIEDLFIA